MDQIPSPGPPPAPGRPIRPPRGLRILDDPALSPQLRRLALNQLGCLSHAQLYGEGVTRSLVSRRCRRQVWGRPAIGVVDVRDPASLAFRPDELVRRRAVIALLAVGEDGVALGISALALLGVQGLPQNVPPEVAVPPSAPRIKRRDGVVIRRCLVPSCVRTAHGFLVVEPVTALAQGLVRAQPRESLGMLDSALHREVITARDSTRVQLLIRRLRGPRRVRVRELDPIWGLADRRRESPLESWAYWDLLARDLKPTDIQVDLRDEHGLFLGRGDIGFRRRDGTWLILEMQGREHHEGALAQVADGERRDPLELEGHTVLEFWKEHLGAHGRMVERVRDHLERRP